MYNNTQQRREELIRQLREKEQMEAYRASQNKYGLNDVLGDINNLKQTGNSIGDGLSTTGKLISKIPGKTGEIGNTIQGIGNKTQQLTGDALRDKAVGALKGGISKLGGIGASNAASGAIGQAAGSSLAADSAAILGNSANGIMGAGTGIMSTAPETLGATLGSTAGTGSALGSAIGAEVAGTAGTAGSSALGSALAANTAGAAGAGAGAGTAALGALGPIGAVIAGGMLIYNMISSAQKKKQAKAMQQSMSELQNNEAQNQAQAQENKAEAIQGLEQTKPVMQMPQAQTNDALKQDLMAQVNGMYTGGSAPLTQEMVDSALSGKQTPVVSRGQDLSHEQLKALQNQATPADFNERMKNSPASQFARSASAGLKSVFGDLKQQWDTEQKYFNSAMNNGGIYDQALKNPTQVQPVQQPIIQQPTEQKPVVNAPAQTTSQQPATKEFKTTPTLLSPNTSTFAEKEPLPMDTYETTPDMGHELEATQTANNTTMKKSLMDLYKQGASAVGRAARDVSAGYEDNVSKSFTQGDLYKGLTGTEAPEIDPSTTDDGTVTGGAAAMKKNLMTRVGEAMGTGQRVLSNPIVQGLIAGTAYGADKNDALYGLGKGVEWAQNKAKSDAYGRMINPEFRPSILGARYDTDDYKAYIDKVRKDNQNANDLARTEAYASGIDNQNTNRDINTQISLGKLQEQIRHNNASEGIQQQRNNIAAQGNNIREKLADARILVMRNKYSPLSPEQSSVMMDKIEKLVSLAKTDKNGYIKLYTAMQMDYGNQFTDIMAGLSDARDAINMFDDSF